MISILITGDFCPLSRVASNIESGYSEKILKDFKSLIRDTDYAITNFEYSIGNSKLGIQKIGPVLYGTEATIRFLKEVGFNCVTLANNHFFDCGQKGVENSIDLLQKYGIDYAGGGKNINDIAKILYKEIDGERIAIINACEYEFSIANSLHGGSNHLDIIETCHSIQCARKNADYIILITHGGIENYQLPSPKMQQKYRFFIENGADIIINHHQHCYSGYEVYNGKYIFYGLGNFCFDEVTPRQPNSWYEGYAVKIDIKDSTISPNIIPYIQCKENPTVSILDNNASFWNNLNQLNKIISDHEQIELLFDKYVKGLRPLVSFTPYKWRILKSLYIRNLFPSFLSKKQKIRILNFTRCESHHEILQRYLSMYYNENIYEKK